MSQQYLSVLTGVVVLTFFLVPAVVTQKLTQSTGLPWLNNRIKKQCSHLFRQRSLLALFLIGLINGLLPCGVVYVALGGALAVANAWSGAGFMAMFGLGTTPLLFSVALGSQWLKQTWRTKLLKATPFFTVALAILLITRGLNLNIPLVSPQLDTSQSASVKLNCCHKLNKQE